MSNFYSFSPHNSRHTSLQIAGDSRHAEQPTTNNTMKIKLSSLAAVLLSNTSSSTVSAYEGSIRTGRDLQQTCNYDTSHEVTAGTTLLWTNDLSGDTEWLNKNNYNYKYLPGVHKFNKVIMAVNDAGTVHCDAASYMNDNVYLELRSGATLEVSANLNIGDQLIMKTNAILSQSSNSILNVGKNLYLAAEYNIANNAALNIGLDLYMASNAKLAIIGDGTSIMASTATPTNSQLHGLITYVLGATGTGMLDLGGELTIGSTTAQIVIDASGYAAGAKSIPLMKYTSVTGAYNAANIHVTGLGLGLDGNVVSLSDGLYLQVTG